MKLVICSLALLSFMSNPKSPEAWAEKLCDCGQPMAQYVEQENPEEGHQPTEAFYKAFQETLACMGGEKALQVPHEGLSVEEQIAFDQKVMQALEQRCEATYRAFLLLK